MNPSPLTIFSVTIFLFLFYYLVTAAYSLAFFQVKAHKIKFKEKRVQIAFIGIALSWLLSTFGVLIFASSSGKLFFGFVAFLLIAVSGFLLSGKLLKLSGRDQMIYSLILAVIINPGWLILLIR